MSVSRTDARKEMQHLIESHNLSALEVKHLILNSVNASFLSEKEKKDLRKIIENSL